GVNDFIASAQYLIENGYTSSKRLAGSGTSAGGIIIGCAITQRPDLFRAAIIEVGDTNPLRSELAPNGPGNAEEYGSVSTPEGFRALLAVDAYQHVRAGTSYPAVLL